MTTTAIDRDTLLRQAYELPLEEIDVSNWHLNENDAHWPYFERLRQGDPIHYAAHSRYGPFWSITKFNDIKYIDMNHKLFSSQGTIAIDDPIAGFETPMFIAMDQPKHDVQRKTVTPVVAPKNLAELAPLIRTRVQTILDGLPVGETFNWVDLVSIELTTQMLATLFNFPFQERHLLTRWSDIATGGRNSGLVETTEQWQQELLNCLAYFTRLWHERADHEPGFDLISMLTHGKDTKDLIERPLEYLGNLLLLIVGGNDTTRNSITGGVLALNNFPDEYQKLRDDVSLIPNMVSEIIRWQTPLAYMRRTALEDVEVGGKQIKKGDKVVMWYVSGNRDAEIFSDPNRLMIDRPNARQHVSFGYGIHRCMGNRLAEMQLKILWEEIQTRFHKVEVVGEAKRNRSVLVRGYTELPVRLIPCD
ncbi:MAG: cytochrome P450 [Gammaproteobacteria bacterium]|nr:cytochrome P450 [Gammaproteobacteria bacterium]